MCRHSLPRFNFPVTRLLHGVGGFIVAHPAPAIAMIVLPLCAAIFLALHRHPRWTAVGRRFKPVAYVGARDTSTRVQGWASHI